MNRHERLRQLDQLEARMALDEAKREHALLKRRGTELHPMAAKLIRQSIDGKLDKAQSLRTGRPVGQPGQRERATVV